MRVTVSSRFLRRAKKLKDPQASMLRAALRRFAADPQDPLLHTHKLKGELAGYWGSASTRTCASCSDGTATWPSSSTWEPTTRSTDPAEAE